MHERRKPWKESGAPRHPAQGPRSSPRRSRRASSPDISTSVSSWQGASTPWNLERDPEWEQKVHGVTECKLFKPNAACHL